MIIFSRKASNISNLNANIFGINNLSIKYIQSQITSKAPRISQYYISIRCLLYNSQIKCID